MRLLKNFDLFKEYYNVNTNQFCFFENLQKTVGIYKIIKSTITGLLVEDGNLYFLFGEEKFLISESHQVLLELKNDVENNFSLVNGNKVLVKYVYQLSKPTLNISPFEYIDEDDSSWEKFVQKILNDRERQRNFIANLMEIK